LVGCSSIVKVKVMMMMTMTGTAFKPRDADHQSPTGLSADGIFVVTGTTQIYLAGKQKMRDARNGVHRHGQTAIKMTTWSHACFIPGPRTGRRSRSLELDIERGQAIKDKAT
jgi:hypothetical protein